jgi:hypothetical protein
VKYVIMLVGLNDIGFAGFVTPISEQVGAADLIAGYRQLIRRAHQDGIHVIGSTIAPFKDAVSAEGFFTADKDRVREEINSCKARRPSPTGDACVAIGPVSEISPRAH